MSGPGFPTMCEAHSGYPLSTNESIEVPDDIPHVSFGSVDCPDEICRWSTSFSLDAANTIPYVDLAPESQVSCGKELLGLLTVPSESEQASTWSGFENTASEDVSVTVRHTFVEVAPSESCTSRGRIMSDSFFQLPSKAKLLPMLPLPDSDASTDATSETGSPRGFTTEYQMDPSSEHQQMPAWYCEQQTGCWMDWSVMPGTQDACVDLTASSPQTFMDGDGLVAQNVRLEAEKKQLEAENNRLKAIANWWDTAAMDSSMQHSYGGWSANWEWGAQQACGHEASMTSSSSDCTASDESKTTVMLRNLPLDYTRSSVLDLLDTIGDFSGTYDFVYLPIDFKSQAGLGYVFVNFYTNADAERCRRVFEGFADWSIPSSKVCSVTWGNPLQGCAAHVERYRNSPVMHSSVPDDWKPVLFTGGLRVAFPPPTKHISAPKFREKRASKQTAGF